MVVVDDHVDEFEGKVEAELGNDDCHVGFADKFL